MSPLLAIDGLTAGYGGLPIIDNINLLVAPQEIIVVIGPNGAGKSTVLKSVFALTSIISGSIRFAGQEIAGIATQKLVPMGICTVPQTRNIFPSLTVRENLDIGTYAAPPRNRAQVEDSVLTLFPDLKAK